MCEQQVAESDSPKAHANWRCLVSALQSCISRCRTVILCTCLLVTMLAQQAAGDTYEDLIRNVLPLYQAPKQQRDLQSLQQQEPVRTDAWRNLQIGEFESKEAFAKRQAAARYQEDAEYSRQLAAWQQKVKSAMGADMQGQEPIYVAHEGQPYPSCVVNVDTEAEPLNLPYFDRSTMSFRNVAFKFKTVETAYRGNQAILGRFAITPWETANIWVRDLAMGEELKRSFAAGTARFVAIVEPVLIDMQSPIVVKPAYRGVDKTHTVLQVAGIIVSRILSDSTPEEYTYSVERDYPAETREGVRFTFQMKPVCLTLVDDKGNPIDGVEITPIGYRPSSLVELVAENAQPGAKQLHCGDKIVEVAGHSVATPSDVISAAKEQPSGAQYSLVYQSIGDGRLYEIKLAGGSPAGIRVFRAYLEKASGY